MTARVIFGSFTWNQGIRTLHIYNIYIYVCVCIVGNPGICKSLGFRVSREHGNLYSLIRH